MSKYEEITQAFAIFTRYEHEHGVDAQHDIIYAGPDPDVMSPEDRAAVEALGWHPEEEYECWGMFT